ncbi:MAG: MBL fold metallo-hydrolase [Alphaproteobacteria bacterium]|nr:MBL fold metallo-hydrolase [Alphaproteobacteria bacterium]
MLRRALRVGLRVLLVVALVLGLTVAYVLSWPDFGGTPEGARLARMQQAAAWDAEAGGFANDPPPPPNDLAINFAEMMGDQERKPPEPFPQGQPRFVEPPAPGLRATWFGHAAVLVEIDGARVMTDPMLSEYAFPVHALAPPRHNPPPLAVEALPPVDVVTISHDHYDHLDMATVQQLAARGTHFFVGLGIGAHLERWGVPEAQIHELDWWESAEHAGLTIHCTPARHYSGRKSMGNPTLWASWVIEGPEHRVYHSGDTGYGPHFAEIGERRGPIDLSLIKIGDYGDDPGWQSIHMVPEDSIRAHQDLGAAALLPIHWGTFELSFHDWDAPIRRASAAAQAAGIRMVTPRLGETVDVDAGYESVAWWGDVGEE